VVGLIAARLKERFRRPAFAFTLANPGTATGSGRSVPSVDLGRVVRAAVDAGLAVKGGGHAMAAGVTVAQGDLERFTHFATERLADQVGDALAFDGLGIDATLTAGGARPGPRHRHRARRALRGRAARAGLRLPASPGRGRPARSAAAGTSRCACAAATAA
jgi:hypothetical protein